MLAAAPDGPMRGVPVVIKDEWPLPWRAERVGDAIQQAASVTEETTTEPKPLPGPALSEARFKPRSLDQ